MFGHISPPGLYHELNTLASLVKAEESDRPLEGLKVFVTHIKEALIPHKSGKSARERILEELIELEKEGKLGVEFIAVQRGDRICKSTISSLSQCSWSVI
jgi:cAMP phosphodiesterase